MSAYKGVAILLIISLLSFSAAANEESKSMNKEDTAVLEAVQAMTSAFHNKDIDGVLASYEGGAGVMFEPQIQISDSNVIRQMFEGAFQVNPRFTYPQGHEVYVSGDIALHIAPWIMTGKSPDGIDIGQRGLSVAVLRKNISGKWLLVLDNPHGQFLMPAN